MAWIWSLAWELPYTVDTAEKGKKKKEWEAGLLLLDNWFRCHTHTPLYTYAHLDSPMNTFADWMWWKGSWPVAKKKIILILDLWYRTCFYSLKICRIFYQSFEIAQWCALASVHFHPFFPDLWLDPLNLEMLLLWKILLNYFLDDFIFSFFTSGKMLSRFWTSWIPRFLSSHLFIYIIWL